MSGVRKADELTYNLLFSLYIEQELSIEQISVIVKMNTNLIGRKIREHNINKLERYLNKKYDKLTVIAIDRKDKYNRNLCKCRCDCGTVKYIKLASLNAGRTTTCGCSRYEIGDNKSNYRGIEDLTGTYWSQIKKGAKQRNIEFNITIQDGWDKFREQNGKCAISGLEIKFAKSARGYRDGITTASLDRIDSSLCYNKNNIQWVHKDVNFMKHAFNEDYFIEMCRLIAENNPRR